MKITLFDRPTGDNPAAAMVLILCGVMLLGLQDSLVKFISSDTSFWQFQSLRAAANIVLLIIVCAIGGTFRLMIPINRTAVFIRALVLMACMFCFFGGAPSLSVAQMATGLYTYPIFITLMAGPVLGETIGKWRVFAVLLGSAGALTILRPWADSFTPVQILPIFAGFFYAINVMIVRRYCRGESPIALTLAVAIVFLASGIAGITLLSLFPLPLSVQLAVPFVAMGWPTLTVMIITFVVIASFLNLFGNICLSRAYQTAESSRLAPLDFSYLLFAALWSKILFDTWPTFFTLIGMALIACAGMLTAWREHVNDRLAKDKAIASS